MSQTLPKLRVEKRGRIYDASHVVASEAVAYFTSLVPLASGTWLAGWQCGPEKHTPSNTIGLARSRDQANTWERLPFRFETNWQGTPGSLLAAEMVETVPGRLMLFTTWVDRTHPDRPLFNPETEGILPTRILACSSDDEGDSWSTWSEISTAELKGCAVTGPAIRWSDGTIACAFESFKEFDDPTPVEPSAWLVTSTNGGETFSAPWRIAKHPQNERYYWDQRLCPTKSAREFIAMYWTHDRPEQRDLDVHFLRTQVNDDVGASELPRATSIPGQIAACAIADDERILAFVVDRGCPGTMTLWQSPDGGASWPESASVVVHTHDEQAAISQGRENIDFAEYWEDMGKWSFGHPAIRQLGNDWLVAWYAGTPDRMSINCAHVSETL